MTLSSTSMFEMIMGVTDHATKDGNEGRAHMLHRSQSIRSVFGHESALARKVIRQLDVVSTCKEEALAKCNNARADLSWLPLSYS